MIGERRLALTDLDIVENAPVSSLIDHRANRDSWLRRIPDPQIRRCGKQTFHHAIIIFFEKDEPRESGAFLSLITERRVN